jgi:transketolase
MHYTSQTGHLGSNLSCLEVMMTLHHEVMLADDVFVLSKGHAAGALYITLWSTGRLDEDVLNTFCQDGTKLPAHPAKSIAEVHFSTGSLGHGPSLAAGMALARKLKAEPGAVYCLCSDGEWQEGSCWEALIFSVHHQLDNLVFLVDQNGLQAFGRTEEVASQGDLESRLAAFDASVTSVDGHDPQAILAGLAKRGPGTPHVVILRTRKGKGLHFEDCIESHYLALTQEQYAAANAEGGNGEG